MESTICSAGYRLYNNKRESILKACFMDTPSLTEARENQARAKLAEGVFLDSHDFHTFNNVPVQAGLRTIQIDHVIVSRFGIFAVETKNRNGWIYGSRSDRQWTQMIAGRKYKFPNPLRRSLIHTLGLAKALGLSMNKMHPVIVFWGNCEFRTIMPLNVLNNKLTGFIKSKKKAILTDAEVAVVCAKLNRMKETTARDTGRTAKMLMRWFGKN